MAKRKTTLSKLSRFLNEKEQASSKVAQGKVTGSEKKSAEKTKPASKATQKKEEEEEDYLEQAPKHLVEVKAKQKSPKSKAETDTEKQEISLTRTKRLADELFRLSKDTNKSPHEILEHLKIEVAQRMADKERYERMLREQQVVTLKTLQSMNNYTQEFFKGWMQAFRPEK